MLPSEERSRGRLSQDLCVLDGEQHFIRGLIELRSLDKLAGDPVLVFGVYGHTACLSACLSLSMFAVTRALRRCNLPLEFAC